MKIDVFWICWQTQGPRPAPLTNGSLLIRKIQNFFEKLLNLNCPDIYSYFDSISGLFVQCQELKFSNPDNFATWFCTFDILIFDLLEFKVQNIKGL